MHFKIYEDAFINYLTQIYTKIQIRFYEEKNNLLMHLSNDQVKDIKVSMKIIKQVQGQEQVICILS